jgi:hypothetical protein
MRIVFFPNVTAFRGVAGPIGAQGPQGIPGGPVDPTEDIPLTGAGKGLIVTTPNGLHSYRIAISNSGVITTEQVT